MQTFGGNWNPPRHVGALLSCIWLLCSLQAVSNDRVEEIVKRFHQSIGEPDVELRYANELVELGERLGDATVQARGKLRVAFCRVNAASQEFHQPYEEARQVPVPEGSVAQAEMLAYGAYIRARGLREFTPAIADLRHAIELAFQLEDDPLLVFSRIMLAEMLTFDGDFEEAKQCLFRASTLAEKEVPYFYELSISRLMLTLQATGSLQMAVPYAKQLIAHPENGRPPRNAERVLFHAGEFEEYESVLRHRLGLPNEASQTSETGHAGQGSELREDYERGEYADLLQLAYVTLDSNPEEALKYSLAAQARFQEQGLTHLFAWSQLVELMARSRLPEADLEDLGLQFSTVLNESSWVHQQIVLRDKYHDVANFLDSVGRQTEADSILELELKVLRRVANDAAINAQANSQELVLDQLAQRESRRAMAAERADMLRERQDFQVQRKKFNFWKTILLGCVAVVCFGFVGYRYTLLHRHKRQLLQEVQEKTEHLEVSKRQAEEARDLALAAEKAKSDFYAQLNHEIRNPLQAVLSFAEVLELKNPPGTESILKGMRSSGDHLMHLINNALDVSQIEGGRVRLAKAPFDLRGMVEQVGSMLETFVEDRTALNVRWELAADLPQQIVGDEVKLRQILINLGQNAVKFTPSGFIRLQVRSVETLTHSQKTVERIQFVISDTGCGISQAEQAFVFEPFFQSKAAKEARVGTGLGLHICKSYCDLMDGTLEVESDGRSGATFSLEIAFEVAGSAVEAEYQAT